KMRPEAPSKRQRPLHGTPTSEQLTPVTAHALRRQQADARVGGRHGKGGLQGRDEWLDGYETSRARIACPPSGGAGRRRGPRYLPWPDRGSGDGFSFGPAELRTFLAAVDKPPENQAAAG